MSEAKYYGWSRENVMDALVLSITETYMDHRPLFQLGANERSLTHQLAVSMTERFAPWHVDCEYNRLGLHEKKLLYYPPSEPRADDIEAKTVFPDIIVHRRTKSMNLLVVEVKKADGGRSDTDIAKLEGFLADPQYRYQHAAFIRFASPEESKRRLCSVALFITPGKPPKDLSSFIGDTQYMDEVADDREAREEEEWTERGSNS